MKPDPKVCGKCNGIITVERFKDQTFTEDGGGVLSSKAVVMCGKSEVPKECPMVLEHTVVQEQK